MLFIGGTVSGSLQNVGIHSINSEVRTKKKFKVLFLGEDFGEVEATIKMALVRKEGKKKFKVLSLGEDSGEVEANIKMALVRKEGTEKVQKPSPLERIQVRSKQTLRWP